MAAMSTSGTLMNLLAKQGACLLLSVPAWGWAADQRPAPDAVEGAMAVMPISMIEPETRGAPRLRESLRHNQVSEADSGKPYRLSIEERHRLREQLRGSTGHDSSSK
jgi:hypothetical protein